MKDYLLKLKYYSTIEKSHNHNTQGVHTMTDYKLIVEQAKSLAEGNVWDITLYANISALIFESLDKLNWAGFYLIRGDELHLGPFQGKTACLHIPIGKGVCGTAVRENRIVRVENVHEFPGHIACDSASESEIVLPVRHNGKIIGVLDIDSTVLGRFTEEDEQGLAQIVEVVENSILQGEY